MRRHYIAVDQGHRKQIRKAVIRLFLCTNDLVHAIKPAAGEVIGELEYFCLNRGNLFRIDLVRLGEFDHAMYRGLRVDH